MNFKNEITNITMQHQRIQIGSLLFVHKEHPQIGNENYKNLIFVHFSYEIHAEFFSYFKTTHTNG